MGALAIVIISLSQMADEVNRIEDTLTRRSVLAAVQATLRRIGETHRDYAQWDDAVRNLSGDINPAFADENFTSSTLDPVFFDSAFLIDEVGNVKFAVHSGKPVQAAPEDIYGPELAKMIGALVRDGRTYDVKVAILSTEWGPASVAVGTLVPVSPDFKPHLERSRVLVLSKSFDQEVVGRLGEDFQIDGLALVANPAGQAHAISLTDPGGAVVAGLSWSPPSLGDEAHARVSPTVFVMLALVGLTMALLIAIALRGVREVERREAHARHAATHDPLSGLPNRVALVAGLDQAIAARRTQGIPVAVVYLDLDGFKEVNDAYGHETGDRLLRAVAEGFRSRSGEHLLARVGGDEFAVVVAGHNAVKIACDLGWRLIGFVREPFDFDGRMVTVGTSVGVAAAETIDASAEELLRRADVAMYQAKQQGPNRMFVYDAVIDTIRHERLEIADDLRRAIRADELELVYQPVFAAESCEIVGVEALLRWNWPNQGPIPPAVFIPIAEQSGLIDELGIWTLRRACTDAADWPGVKVAVNVSPAQFRNPSFENLVADVVRETGFRAAPAGDRSHRVLLRREPRSGAEGDRSHSQSRGLRGARRFRHRLFEHRLSSQLPV